MSAAGIMPAIGMITIMIATSVGEDFESGSNCQEATCHEIVGLELFGSSPWEH